MSLETKVLLVGMAQYAIATNNKGMYDYVQALANTEQLALPEFKPQDETAG